MRAWLKDLHTSTQVFGEPEEWHLDYPKSTVKNGFWMWMASGFQKMPHPDEVTSFPEAWISDMKLLHTIYAHQGNQTMEQKLVEQFLVNEQIAKLTDMSDKTNAESDPDQPAPKKSRYSFVKQKPKPVQAPNENGP